MNRDCKLSNYCRMCYLEACPFGRNASPSEDEYKEARNKCKYYQPKETDNGND